MALKDWKKVNSYTWKKKNDELQIGEIRTTDASKIESYVVEIWRFDKDYKKSIFKTKSQALRFAKSYMRKN